jgi:hypothetical protein
MPETLIEEWRHLGKCPNKCRDPSGALSCHVSRHCCMKMKNVQKKPSAIEKKQMLSAYWILYLHTLYIRHFLPNAWKHNSILNFTQHKSCNRNLFLIIRVFCPDYSPYNKKMNSKTQTGAKSSYVLEFFCSIYL